MFFVCFADYSAFFNATVLNAMGCVKKTVIAVLVALLVVATIISLFVALNYAYPHKIRHHDYDDEDDDEERVVSKDDEEIPFISSILNTFS